MANEITAYGSLNFADSEGTDVTLDLEQWNRNVSTKKYVKGKISAGTSEEAIPLGEVSSLGWGYFINRDETNYVEIRSASGAGNDIIKIPPLTSVGPFHFGSDITAPYIIANTAACQVEYLIVST